ncbi:histone-lysine N-methyltransferase SETMAR-like [Octopus sinensis]|uniref:Histone-lysine N-methyltransferase SETMAR-like n=1 Tax=Octopus sinensis TaxID=2607531 RepID=A0A7E6ES18_9MOLL|nr:histone-lysine N-methyltransferase SETMAR-like [Octopus sinensis]
MQTRQISYRQIAQRLGISTQRADKIVTKELGFSKVSARWVPPLLIPEQKRTRCTLSTSNLELFEASMVAMAIIRDCGYELVPHPPYSPNLAPSDFQLFPKLRKALTGRHFVSDNDIIDAVGIFLDSETKEFYVGIMALQHRWIKCSTIEGNYVKK